jgi:D-alanine-D-alanine ligase
MSTPAAEIIVAVFCGGTSSEREVSLGSGQACALALARSFPVRFFEINADAVPAEIDPARHVVFSALHGGFGEDGGMQRALEAAGVGYAGCGPESCALTIDKTRTKQVVARAGVRVADGIQFSAGRKPAVDDIVAQLGEQLVLKPNDQGSSVGLSIIQNRAELSLALDTVKTGNWLVERRIIGRELHIGILDGRAMGVVEVRPKSGVYDYASKYTKGLTDYFAPAELSATVTVAVQRAAEAAFAACGCRDYARLDFMLSADGQPHLLEINPLPGMKETSLLPMSARCVGLDFTALVRRMVQPAIERHAAARARPARVASLS